MNRKTHGTTWFKNDPGLNMKSQMSDGLTNTLFSVMFQKKEKGLFMQKIRKGKKKENRVAVSNIFFCGEMTWGY